MNPMKNIPPERNDGDLPASRRRSPAEWVKRSTKNTAIGAFALLVLFCLLVYLVSNWR